MDTTIEPLARVAARRRRRRSGDGQVLGGLLVIVGVGWLLQQSGVVDVGAEVLLSCLLIALGLGLVFTARRAGGGKLIVLGVILTVILAGSSSAPKFDVRWNHDLNGIGDKTVQPLSLPENGLVRHQGIGKLQLDLRRVAPFTGEKHVVVGVNIGEVDVRLPASGPPVKVLAHAAAGDIHLPGVDQSGNDNRRTYTEPSFDGAESRLVIEADVQFGSITVTRDKAG
ncbi:MAG: Cell wall-active antibiotics response YvqF [Actinomycetota bacterium]|jgi:hypothetical protein|nr:Cell wall-active antibiotics response YvqF [Actinomycetota bacterium]